MTKPIRKYQQIPTQLADYVVKNDLIKSFQIYMYFKCCCNGFVNKNSEVFSNAKSALKINTNRTFKKHFEKLVELNWVGYNPITKNYFIRSIDTIRVQHDFTKRQSATFSYKDINKFREFLCAVIVSANIKGQKFYFEVGQKRKTETAGNKLVTALQVKSSSSTPQNWVPRRQINDKASRKSKSVDVKIPDYYGMSLVTMADKIGRSKTTACDLKQAMLKAGFIKVKHHERVIETLQNRDYTYRKKFYTGFPDLVGRLSFRKRKIQNQSEAEIAENKKAKTVIDVVLLLHDEIIPTISFKKVQKFSAIGKLKAVKNFQNTKSAA